MVDDPDIYRAAKLLADQHGEDAPIRAAGRADGRLEDADTEGTLVWLAIVTAIGELRQDRRRARR
jgi:hypothetical protein